MFSSKSLGKKILRAMTALVIGLLLLAGTIFAFTVKKASLTLASSNRDLSETIGETTILRFTPQGQCPCPTRRGTAS